MYSNSSRWDPLISSQSSPNAATRRTCAQRLRRTRRPAFSGLRKLRVPANDDCQERRPRPERAVAHNASGTAYLQLKQFDKAEAEFTNALQQDKSFASMRAIASTGAVASRAQLRQSISQSGNRAGLRRLKPPQPATAER